MQNQNTTTSRTGTQSTETRKEYLREYAREYRKRYPERQLETRIRCAINLLHKHGYTVMKGGDQ